MTSPRRTLVLGGARSGKSEYAESLAASLGELRYVATGYPAATGDSWADRVARHQLRRPSHWTTHETLDVAAVLADDSSPVLIDCMSLWLTRTMDAHDAWTATAIPTAMREAIDAVVTAWSSASIQVIAVTSETGLGVIPSTTAGARFRDELGELNRRLAAASDEVWLVVAGLPQRLK